MFWNELYLRRIEECRNVPACPSCGETKQIQLKDWINEPVIWKCRMCKRVYTRTQENQP